MIPRVAPTGLLTQNRLSERQHSERQHSERQYNVRYFSPCFALRLAVALVLFALSVAALKAQEPEQWPQDDDDSTHKTADAGDQQYSQPQPYDNGQSGAQQGYGQQSGYGQQLGAMPAQGLNAQQLEQLVAPIALYPDT